MAKHFVLALVHKQNDFFGISFPDYPGCISGGSSFEEAVNKGASALSFHLKGMESDGDDIRTPSPMERAFQDSIDDVAEGAMPVFLEIEFPGKAVRINVSMEEGLLSQVDKAAQVNGQSRSAFLADSVRARLHVRGR